MDDLAYDLLRLSDRFGSALELIETCRALAGGGDAAVAEVRQRLSRLLEFGALEVARPELDTEVLLVDPPCPDRMVGTLGPAKGLCYLSDSLVRHGLPPAHILDLRSVSRKLNGRAEWAEYFCRHLTGRNPRIVGYR